MNQLADDDYDYILIKILILLVGNCVKWIIVEPIIIMFHSTKTTEWLKRDIRTYGGVVKLYLNINACRMN